VPIEYGAGFQIIQRILLSVGRSVVPLYIRDPNKGIEFVGSSVYCRLDNLILLFTARHVVADVWPKRLLYPYSTMETRELPCNGFCFPKEEADDYCAAELTSDLNMWSPFPYNDIEEFQSYKEYQHLLIGYPGSYTNKSTPAVQKLKLQGYLSGAAPESEYTRLRIDPAKEFVVLFKKEKGYDANRAHTNFPDPYGMSGGGIFQFNENIPQVVSLVGIMSWWDTNRKNAIIGIRLEAIKSLLNLKKLV
jgi:hypothetical protein